MRIAMEFGYAGAGGRGGTQTIRHLVQQISCLDSCETILVFGFFFRDFSRKLEQLGLAGDEKIRLCVRRWPESVIDRLEWDWNVPVIESYLRLKGVDLYDCFRPPSRGYETLVMRGADVTQITHPHWHTPESMRVWERITKPGLLKAKRIIGYSRHQRDDIIRALDLPPERVTFTYPGVDHSIFRKITDPLVLENARRAYRLPERFLLMVGPFDVVQNFAGVVAALKRWRTQSEPPPIVAVGPVDNFVRGLQRRADEAGVGDLFCWPGYVHHRDLAPIMNLAEGLVYPSLLPGVEMPPMEALACGTPVICSLEEVIADSGLLIDARSPNEIYGAMRQVYESAPRREELSQRGMVQASQFTWERLARETMAIYRDALS